MIEQIRHRADTIKNVIGQQPERGINLLLDFEQEYGVDEDIENEILLCQYQLNAAVIARHEATEGEGTLDDLKVKLSGFVDAIVDNYDEAKREDKVQKEAALVYAVKQIPMRNDVVLTAKDIVKNYRSSRFKLKANHVELRLGEITGLVGENATGKTTLLNILTGVIAPDKDVVNYPLFDPKGRKDWSVLKMRIAYVSQHFTKWEGSLLENLAFEAARHGIKGEDNKKAVERIVQRLGLALHTDKSWTELSGGYKLRFALAKALVWHPQLLILDEPLAYLDIKAQHVVLSDLRDLAKSLKNPLAILISSQHLHETESVADKMWFMRQGTLENLGSTEAFNSNRTYNFFELSSSLAFTLFEQQLADLKTLNPTLKTWANDKIYFIKTPLSISADNFIDYCQAKGIKLLYFRDVSQSVKTKFYEEDL
jgi:ABC-2 type transport system ATP-binding protein